MNWNRQSSFLVRIRAGITLLPLFLLPVLAAAEPKSGVDGEQPQPPVTIRIGYENSSYFPWSLPDGSGADIELLKAAALKNNLTLQMQSLPWDQCLNDLEAGKLDSVLNASYSRERAELFCYPMKDGKPDLSRRLHMDGYSLYLRSDTAGEWENGKLEGYAGPVATQPGFSVIALLKQAGVKVDDQYGSTEEILRRMQTGQIRAAALLTANAEYVLRGNPKLAEGIRKTRNDLVFKAYYLIFSKAFVRRHPQLTEKIWNDLAAERCSPGYGQLIARMYASQSCKPKPGQPLTTSSGAETAAPMSSD